MTWSAGEGEQDGAHGGAGRADLPLPRAARG